MFVKDIILINLKCYWFLTKFYTKELIGLQWTPLKTLCAVTAGTTILRVMLSRSNGNLSYVALVSYGYVFGILSSGYYLVENVLDVLFMRRVYLSCAYDSLQ